MRARFGPLVLLVALSAGCGPAVDLTKTLQVSELTTGWLDAGVVPAGNKLVPSVSFKLTNGSDQPLGTLQLNVLFRRVAENDEIGSGFLAVAGSEGLAPGATTRTLTVNSQLGYTGTEPRQQMLQNSRFVDAKVEVFAKYGSLQWKRIGEYPIARQLITR